MGQMIVLPGRSRHPDRTNYVYRMALSNDGGKYLWPQD